MSMHQLHTYFDNKDWHIRSSGGASKIYWRGLTFDRNGKQNSDLSYIGRSIELTNGDLLKNLSEISGFYAFIHDDDHKIFAAVDIIRSIPIFYAISDGHCYISDSAEWVREMVGGHLDPIAEKEFLLSGFVLGRNTLYSEVKQLQAGEVLMLDKRSGALNLQRYYVFNHTEPASWDVSVLKEGLAKVLGDCFERLISFADGRQIVVPLSGGYDSRLIVTMLRRLEYKNVLCFSYGVRGNSETAISKHIAEVLGFPWEFVEYTTESVAKDWAKSDAAQFRRTAGGYASLPHPQDWFAVKDLCARGVIDSHAVVVPGHAADFVAGSHIPDFIFSMDKVSWNKLIESIYKKHLSNSTCVFENDADEIYERVIEGIKLDFREDRVSFANCYEQWGWQERQAKYIANSVRVYEYFGLSWWLPFWDRQFVQFWHEMPLSLRRGRKWFIEFIRDIYATTAEEPGEASVGNAASTSRYRKWLVSVFKLLPSSLRSNLRKRRQIAKLKKHPLCFQSIGDSEEILRGAFHGENIIGTWSRLYLENRWE